MAQNLWSTTAVSLPRISHNGGPGLVRSLSWIETISWSSGLKSAKPIIIFLLQTAAKFPKLISWPSKLGESDWAKVSRWDSLVIYRSILGTMGNIFLVWACKCGFVWRHVEPFIHRYSRIAGQLYSRTGNGIWCETGRDCHWRVNPVVVKIHDVNWSEKEWS